MQKHILVLYGGTSNERSVSLRSGATIAKALKAVGYNVALADTARPGFELSLACKGVDVVVPMLHGKGGEDGSLQRHLEMLRIPYVGSTPDACERAFNKVACKELLAEHGVLTPLWEVVNRSQFEAAPLQRHSYVLKPIEGGSTIDTRIVHNPTHQAARGEVVDALFARYQHMLLEELIEGMEITVGVLAGKALPVIHIVPPPGQEFDYENKYNGKTQEIVESTTIPSHIQREAQRLAERLHRMVGCRHLSRTDMIVDSSGALYVLEINTIPGMTPQSLFPRAAAAAGMSMEKLAEQLVNMAATA